MTTRDRDEALIDIFTAIQHVIIDALEGYTAAQIDELDQITHIAIIMSAFTDLIVPFNELSGVSFTYGQRVGGKFAGSDHNRATAVQWTWDHLNNSGLIGNLSSDAAQLVANTHETPSMGDHFMIVQNPEVERIFMDGAARIRSIFPALKSNISSIKRTKFFKEFMDGRIVGSLKFGMAYLKEYIDFN